MKESPFSNSISKMSPNSKWSSLAMTWNSPKISSRITTFFTDYRLFKGKTFFKILNYAKQKLTNTFLKRAKLPRCSLSSEKDQLASSSIIRKKTWKSLAPDKVSENWLSFIPHLDQRQSRQWNTANFCASLIRYSRRPCNKSSRKIINSPNPTSIKLLSLNTWPVKRKPILRITPIPSSSTKAM